MYRGMLNTRRWYHVSLYKVLAYLASGVLLAVMTVAYIRHEEIRVYCAHIRFKDMNPAQAARYYSNSIYKYHCNSTDKHCYTAEPPKYYSNSTDTAVFSVPHTAAACPEGQHRTSPKLVIIGGTKCSTESVSAMVNLHPQMKSEELEVNYFPLSWYNRGTQAEYSTHLPCTKPGQISVDRSAEYFHQSKIIPKEMFNIDPEIKLILLVRDPVDRVISHFVFRRDARKVISTGTTLEDYVLNQDGSVKNHKDIIESSRYYDHLMNWLQFFPANQILVFPYEAIRYQPYQSLRKIEHFMNLNHSVTEDMFVYNRHRGFYCYVIRGTETCLPARKGLPHEKFSQQTIDKLTNYYHPHNARFYQLMNMDYGWRRPKTPAVV